MLDKSFRKRWLARLGWALFALLLAGVGLGVHLVLPPAPRCTVHLSGGTGYISGISADGKSLVTFEWKETPTLGPWRPEVTLKDQRASIVDTLTGEERTVTLPAKGPLQRMGLAVSASPSFQYVLLYDPGDSEKKPADGPLTVTVYMVESSTGSVVATLPAMFGNRFWCDWNEEYLLYVAQKPGGMFAPAVWSAQERRVVGTLPYVKPNELHWEFHGGSIRPEFSPDGHWLAVYSRNMAHETTVYSLFNVQTGERMWENTELNHREVLRFSPDSQFLIYSGKWDEMTIVETRTGAVRWSDPFTSSSTAGQYMVWHLPSNDKPNFLEKLLGKWYPFAETNSPDEIAVGRIADGSEIARLQFKTTALAYYLSPDGRTLITGTSDGTTFQAWDLPPRPRWGWVLGVPCGLALPVLLLKWWIARRKRPVVAAQPVPTA